jgi:excisionase family DNA binding protein
MSSEYYEHWLEEQDRLAAVEHAEWLKTPEGAAWKLDHEKLRVAMEWRGIQAEKERIATERARDERERQWRDDNRVEWVAWKRLQVVMEQGPILFGTSDVKPYDFEAFLAEVEPAPPDATHIEQKDVRVPFRPGNLRWARPDVRQAETEAEPEYISLQEVVRRCGFSYDFVYDAVTSGDLIGVQKGRQWRVKPADFRAWMDRGGAGGAAPSRPEVKESVSRHFPRKAR